MALDRATRATGGYPADLRNGAGIKINKVGLRADISLDLSQTQKLTSAPAGGLVPVQDPTTGLLQALDFSQLPTSNPADGSVANAKLTAVPSLTVKGNTTGANAQPQDVPLSTLAATGNPIGDAIGTKATSQQPASGFAVAETLASFRMRVVSEHVNLGDARWGGKFNGIDDDTPAFAAALAAFAPYGQYTGKGPRFIVPGKGALLKTGSIDITGCHGASIRGGGGAGRGSLVLEAPVGSNYPVLKNTDLYSNPLVHFELGPCLILGGGNNPGTTPNAHGLDLGANFAGRYDVTAWRCVSGIRSRDCFYTVLDNPLINGQGGLACYDGLVQLEGDLSKNPDNTYKVYENGLIILGGFFVFCLRDGWRAENWTGTCAIGTQSFGHARFGLYVGDPAVGKPTMWPLLTGVALDTCGNSLFKGTRGLASVAGHGAALNLFWLGNTAGTGAMIDLSDWEKVGISVDCAINSVYVAILNRCSRVALDIRSVVDYDKGVQGAPAVLLADSIGCGVRMQVADAKQHSTTAVPSASVFSVIETGTSKRNRIEGNLDGDVALIAGRAAGDKSSFIGHAEGIPKLINYTASTV